VSQRFVEAAIAQGYEQSDFNGVQQEGAGLYQVTVKMAAKVQQWHFCVRLKSPNLTIQTGALVTRLLFEARGGVVYVQNGTSIKLGSTRSDFECWRLRFS